MNASNTTTAGDTTWMSAYTEPEGGTIETENGTTTDVPGGTLIYGDGTSATPESGAVITKPDGTIQTVGGGYMIMPNGTVKWINPFIDVFEIDWFCGDVEYVYVNGLFKGTIENTFSPITRLHRGMYIILGRNVL